MEPIWKLPASTRTILGMMALLGSSAGAGEGVGVGVIGISISGEALGAQAPSIAAEVATLAIFRNWRRDNWSRVDKCGSPFLKSLARSTRLPPALRFKGEPAMLV
jgi:hypothetical protein